MLGKKMLRDIINHKTQFASIFLMAFIGVLMFSGINGESDGLQVSIDKYYEETNLADGWIYSIYLNDLFLEQVKCLGATDEMEREMVIVSDAVMDRYPDITLHFVENNTISKFYLLEGEPLDINDSEGVWLDKSFADARNLKVGDNISFKFEGYEIEKQIRGLGYSPEYVYHAPYYSVKQNYSNFGFAYLSHKAFPSDTVPYNVLKVKFSGTPEMYRDILDYHLHGYYSSFVPRSHQSSVSEFDNEIAQHRMMANIFPAIFVFVSMIMLLTSMKRIIANQRTHIGILKANGFTNTSLVIHYLSYGFLIILIASLLGLILGPVILSKLSYPLMDYKFRMPYWDYVGGWNYFYIVVLMLLMSAAVSYYSIRSIMEESPSVMIRPKPPKLTSSRFVEKLPFWKKMSFNIRWNYRDAKRNKLRPVMAVLGVMGCTLLLISAFGLHDGMDDSKDWEFNDIIHYESKLAIDENATSEQVGDVADKVNGDKLMEAGIEISTNHTSKSGVLLVLNHTDLITPTDKDRNPVKINDDVSISQKMANLLNVSVGDAVKWHVEGSDKWVETKIDKIHADPVSQGLIMSADKLNEIGLNYTPTSIVTSQHVDGNYDGIKSIDYDDDLYTAWDDTNRAVSFLITILVSFAVVLAMVVLYNLGLLTYTEMERDIATLKVLGFRSSTLLKILFTQSLFLSVVGFVLGMPIGYYILTALWNSVGEKRYVVASVSQANLLLTFGLIMGVLITINLIFYYKIRRLDMVDTLKILE